MGGQLFESLSQHALDSPPPLRSHGLWSHGTMAPLLSVRCSHTRAVAWEISNTSAVSSMDRPSSHRVMDPRASRANMSPPPPRTRNSVTESPEFGGMLPAGQHGCARKL